MLSTNKLLNDKNIIDLVKELLNKYVNIGQVDSYEDSQEKSESDSQEKSLKDLFGRSMMTCIINYHEKFNEESKDIFMLQC